VGKCRPGCMCGRHSIGKCVSGCSCAKHTSPRPWLDEARRKSTELITGVRRSVEEREKMSKGQIRRFSDVAQREIVSQAALAKFERSPGLRELLALRQVQNWQDPEYRKKHAIFLEEARKLRPEVDWLIQGYVVLHLPHHPLARSRGSVLEHRRVLYDDIGPGPHPCHWIKIYNCGKSELQWTHDIWGICVDHLDRNRRNNVRENLVPSCHSCNSRRRNAKDPGVASVGA
jgi:hypothetical protein